MSTIEKDEVHAAVPAAAPQPVVISAATINSLISHESLIQHLRFTLPPFSATIFSPFRHTHQTSHSSSLLLMPSWCTSPPLPYMGVKLVTHFANNSSLNLPGVHAVYVLFNSLTGQPLASMDATGLTLFRTACVSALASYYLSRENAETLVMIGAGSLAPHLIRAHLTTRPSLKRVVVWNRSVEKAKILAAELTKECGIRGVCFESNECLEEVVKVGDIVSCATNSESPLVRGADLKAGAHLDLVGSFTPSMRECDDEAVRRGRVYIDNGAAVVEAGELVGAFERGVKREDEIVGDLVELIRGEKCGRSNLEEITLFKSVGSAVVDLLSAQLVYESFMKNQA